MSSCPMPDGVRKLATNTYHLRRTARKPRLDIKHVMFELTFVQLQKPLRHEKLERR